MNLTFEQKNGGETGYRFNLKGRWVVATQMSNEKNLGWFRVLWLGYIGIIINHYKDPY